MKWPDELVAAHELGHLIVVDETGLRSRGIKLETSWWSDEVSGAYCDLRGFQFPVPGNNPEPGGWDLYRGMLIMTAAGQAASEHWFELHDHRVDWTAGSDYAAFCKDAPVMPNAPSWDEAKAEAKHLIVARWDEIEALTPELVEKRRMAGSRV